MATGGGVLLGIGALGIAGVAIGWAAAPVPTARTMRADFATAAVNGLLDSFTKTVLTESLVGAAMMVAAGITLVSVGARWMNRASGRMRASLIPSAGGATFGLSGSF